MTRPTPACDRLRLNPQDMAADVESALSKLPSLPYTLAVVLGTGWGNAAEAWRVHHALDYAEVPTLGGAGVQGHAGRILAAEFAGHAVVAFQGRRHWFEGLGWNPVLFPVFVAHQLGIRTLLLTNGAGSLRTDFPPGTLMAVDDHINAMGVNPLCGAMAQLPGGGFPDLTNVYDPRLRACMDDAASAVGVPLRHGIYAAVQGPTYETPAEVRALRTMGADAVGMSTVPEAVVARALGIRVAALSCMTNLGAGLAAGPITHDGVLGQAHLAEPSMRRLLERLLASLPGSGPA